MLKYTKKFIESFFWFIIVVSLTIMRYNMVGHFKFASTLLGGFLIFHDPLIPVQFIGIFLTFSGNNYFKIYHLNHKYFIN